MSYRGDIRLGDTIDVKFTTRRFSTGAPHTLAGTPAVAAYVDNGTTEITAGITLTVDFDSRTGLNNVRVVATSGNGFASGTNVDLVITAGTVDSVSVVGEVVGSFSIEKRSAVMPTTAGRTLTIESDGMAHADVKEAAGTAWNSGAIGASTLASDTITDAKVASDVTIASVTGAVGSVTAAVTVGTNNDKTGYRLSATGVDDVWDEAQSGHTTAGTFGRYLDGQVANVEADTQDIQSRLPAALTAGGNMKSDALAISGDATAADNLEAILDGTGGVTLVASAFTLTTPIQANAVQISGDITAADNCELFFDGTGYNAANSTIGTVTTATNVTTVNGLSAGVITATSIAADAITAAKIATGAIDADALAADVVNDIWMGTALTESYAADGAAGTPAQMLYLIQQMLTEFVISGTTWTTRKLDGSTTAATFTLDSSSTPTGITRSG